MFGLVLQGYLEQKKFKPRIPTAVQRKIGKNSGKKLHDKVLQGDPPVLQVDEYNAVRLKLTAEMADSSNLVKACCWPCARCLNHQLQLDQKPRPSPCPACSTSSTSQERKKACAKIHWETKGQFRKRVNSCFSNRALVKTIFEAPNASKNSVFEAEKWVSTKTLLLKHYYHRQGYPRSSSRSGGTCERTLIPVFVSGGTSECSLVLVFVPGEHPPNPPFLDNHPFVSP